MGASESTALQVNFNRPNHFYCLGEQVVGIVCFENVHDNMKVDEIFIELVGQLCYTTQETRSTTDSNGNSTSETYTENHYIPFLTLRMPLAQSKDEKNKMTLDHGKYTWPFQFQLPQDLPPSSSPNSNIYPHIKYYTRIVVDRPWYKPNIWKNYPLTVYSHSNILDINDIQQPLYFDEKNRKQLRLEGYLYTSSITPGQPLSFQFTLHNPERTTIKKIQVSFVQCRKTNNDYGENMILHTDLPGLNEFNDSNLQLNFTVPIPCDYFTPTHTFTTLHHNQSYYFTTSYELRLEVRAHGTFTKLGIKVPVIVRAKPMNIDSPPSYKSIINK